MRRDDDEGGGALTRVLVTALVIAVIAFGTIYVFTKAQSPLAAGEPQVAFNHAVTNRGTALEPTIGLVPNGQIYVATTIRNTGRAPITLQGLGTPEGVGEDPYVPADLRLGDGTTADPGAAAPFESTRLGSGESVGVLVTYYPNVDLICRLFSDLSAGSGTLITSFPIRYTTFGIEDQQTVRFDHPVVTVERPTRADCEKVAIA
jgi:hypothetical protein